MLRQTAESPSHFLVTVSGISHNGWQTAVRFWQRFSRHSSCCVWHTDLQTEGKEVEARRNNESIQLLPSSHVNNVKCGSCKGSRIHEQKKNISIPARLKIRSGQAHLGPRVVPDVLPNGGVNLQYRILGIKLKRTRKHLPLRNYLSLHSCCFYSSQVGMINIFSAYY